MKINKSILQSRNKDMIDLDSQMIPMINIVFLLLIFFMIAGQIQKPSPQQVNLSQTKHQSSHSHDDLRITLTSDGEWLFDNSRVTPIALDSILKQAQKQNPETQTKIAVYVDQLVTVETMNQLLKQIRQSGAEKVYLVTRKDAKK